MREILFRGKRKDNGEWAEGCLIRDEFCNTDIPYIGYLSDYDICAVEVTPETVGQFTGLTDKNFKKIFEGDILSSPWGYKGVVEYDTIMYAKLECLFNEDCEVIGNIHDQPELVMPQKGE